MSLKKFWNSVAGFYLVTRNMNAVMFLAMLSTSSLLSKIVIRSLFYRRGFLHKVKKMEQKWNEVEILEIVSLISSDPCCFSFMLRLFTGNPEI